MLTSVSLAIYKVVLEHGTHNSDLLKRNLELLLEKEGPSTTDRKLMVCYCLETAPTNGYYIFSKMKNHCHYGVGNDCTGKVYNCPHTWYCDL